MKPPTAVPWLFLTPFIVLYGVFTLYPLADSLHMSRVQTAGLRETVPVGWQNYRLVLTDADFWKTLETTARFAAGSLLIQLPVALGLALLLHHRAMPARGVFRLVFFSPVLIGGVFVGAAFQFVYGEQYGLLNGFLAWITAGRVSAIHWLTDPDVIITTLVLTGTWMYAGYNMIYFLAGLQGIPQELYEAAACDGASPLRRFWHVTLPGLRQVGAFIVTTSIIGSFALFDLPRVLISDSAPGRAGTTVMMYLYERGFMYGDLGYAAATAWILVLMLLVLTAAQLRLMRGFASE